MADPKTIRINDADDPDRLDAFEKALKRCSQDASAVIRHLAEAYIRYVAEHGHAPAFPVRLEPVSAPKKKRGR